MHTRRVKQWLWVVCGLTTAAGLAAILLPLAMPLERLDRAASPPSGHSLLPTTRSSDGLAPLASFQAAWSKDLRRPLFDPPVIPVAQKATTPLALKLVGTIIELRHSKAVFTLPEGKTELKGVGDTLAGAQVLEIEADKVTVLYDGQSIVLNLAKEPALK